MALRATPPQAPPRILDHLILGYLGIFSLIAARRLVIVPGRDDPDEPEPAWWTFITAQGN